MNKNIYRVIFNQVRGALMVVAETASAHGKGRTACGHSTGVGGSQLNLARWNPLAFATLLAWGMTILLVPAAHANIVADSSAPKTQQPTILSTANGVPQVNIQTPSAAGVSRNTYSQFDVNQQGVILNNARTNAQTQLGGWVQGNPWLAAGTARVILNEVNSSNPSQLQGYVEVAGDRAQVVIANPAGISCNGCGFINASRSTLTTGTPVINGGSLDGYLVERGVVSIDGAGLDASRSDYTDIIARAVQVNAAIWANDLKVTAGANQVSAANTSATPISGTGTAPSFAVDVASLGGMYAGKITLVGTEAGVGVRNAGQIGASAGEVTLTSDGHLENTGTISGNSAVHIAAHDGITNSGILYSQGSMQLSTPGNIDNLGIAAARNNATLLANGANSHITSGAGSVFAAGLNQDSSLNTSGDLTLSATQGVAANTQNLAGGNLSISSATVDLSNSQTSAGGNMAVNVTQGELDGRNTSLVANGQLALSAQGQIATNATSLFVAGQNLAVTAAGLAGDGQMMSYGNAQLALSGDYTHTGTLQADGNAEINIAGNLNNQSQMLAGGAMSIQAANIDNATSGSIIASQTGLTTSGTLSNRGLIDGLGTQVSAASLNNLGTGRIYGDQLSIAAVTLNNDAENAQAPVIAARNRLDLGVATLNNHAHALIFSAGDIAIGGALDANRQATGQAGSINNTSATIESLGNLDISSAQISNINEHFSTQQVQVLQQPVTEYQLSGSPNRYDSSVAYMNNGATDGLLQAITPAGTNDDFNRYAYTRTVTETQVNESDPGQILAGGDMAIAANTLLNDKSRIVAGGNLMGAINTLTNTEVAGTHVTTDSGSATHYYRIHEKGQDSQGADTSSYNPAATVQQISLTPTVYAQNTTTAGTGTQLLAVSLANLAQGSTAPVNVTLQSSLFQLAPNASAGYLIETDPRFASYRTWLSSDYMLQQLNLDPATLQARLGDGFYEQKLIREQIASLTGRRFLDGYANDEAQYQALLDNAVTVAKEWNLIPGVALTPEQIVALTSDIVWLVEKMVTLPNGQTTKALVPQVYVRVKPGDINGAGSLLSASSIHLDLKGDPSTGSGGTLTNAGTIAGRQVVNLSAQNIHNLGGRISATDVAVSAQHDLNNFGGTLQGENSLIATAGHDLNVISNTSTQDSEQGSRTNISRVAGLYVSAPGGTLVAMAGNDINLNAAAIGNSGDGGQTLIVANHNLNLGTVTETSRQSIVWDDKNYRKDASQTETGTIIQTQGDVQLVAGHDLTARAANVTSAQGALLASAGNDIVLTSGSNRRSLDEAYQVTGSSSAFSSTTTTTRATLDETRSRGSTFSGNTVELNAGRDLTLQGSNAVSTQGTQLAAGNNVTLEAATNTVSETHFKDESKSGLFSTGGIGVTIGTQQQSMDAKNTGTTASASTVGSIQGNVDIQAGQAYRQTGSDVLAPQGDIDIAAQKIDIVEAQNASRSSTETRFRQSGLTLALTSPVISAIQTVSQMKDATSQTSDSRMQALAAGSAGLAGKNAYDAIQAGQGSTLDGKPKQMPVANDKGEVTGSRDATAAEQAGGINLSISIGGSQSQSNSVQTASTAAGSTVAAGGNVKLSATGAGKDSDLTVQGSSIKSGNDIALKADDEINLLAARNTAEQHSTNKSSSASIGVSFGTSGFGVTLAASAGRGNADGSDVTWSNTHVEASNQLTLQSGGDTTLRGAVASGQQVIADVGGNLNIESLQDTSQYDSKQQNIGGSVTVGAGVSGSISASQSKVNSSFASVTEQSGIQAGDGGFQIEVQSNTDLKGAVIASTDKAVEEGRNSLAAGTLTTSDIHNHAEASAESSGFNLSSDMVTQGKYGVVKGVASNALNNGKESGSSSGQTLSAVSGAEVVITDKVAQQQRTGLSSEQAVAGLNRYTASAHTAVQQQDLETMRQTVEAERAIKMATFNEAVKFSDEAYRVSFLEKARMYKVARDPDDGKIIKGEDGNPVMKELTEPEKMALKPEPGGKLNVFTNGIFNDEAAAGGYAVQMSELPPGQDVYLVYYPQANNALSELMVAGYQKFLEGGIGDLANASQEMKRLMEQYGAEGLNLVGHSRGAMTIGNAMESLVGQPGSGGVLYNTEIKLVGPAYSAQDAATMLDGMSNGNRSVVLLQNHADDFVGRLIGGNPATFAKRPEDSSMLTEWQRMFGAAPTVHSCYGTGAVDPEGCKGSYGLPKNLEVPSRPVNLNGGKP